MLQLLRKNIFKNFRIPPEFYPKTFTVIKGHYSLQAFSKDFQAALLIAAISVPLAMALSIASGCSPARGLYTSVVAGFLISFLGGSRHQIAGPTSAYIVIVFNIIQKHGFEGMVIATIMAGLILILAGVFKFGTIIKYLPFPITTGFTTGIGLLVFISQIKDVLGLKIENVPSEVHKKIIYFYQNIDKMNWQALALSVFTILSYILIKKWKPKAPVFFITFILGTLVSLILKLDVATIYSSFGEIPKTLPALHIPSVSFGEVISLFPAAFTIAFLGGIESLLSCVIADSIAGTKHRSNCELIAQGVGNIGAVLFGGIPATGALSRTATNVRAGASTPISGMLHAVIIFLMMFFFSPYIKWIPLSCLASALLIISVHMIDKVRIRSLLRSTKSDLLVFLVTLFLTIFLDITVAIQVGVILALLFFTVRMIEVTEEHVVKPERRYNDIQPYEHELHTLPNEIEMIHIAGPFFFGVASKVSEILKRISEKPRVIILDMKSVPFIDASGVFVLTDFMKMSNNKNIRIIITDINKKVKQTILRMTGNELYKYSEIVDEHDKAIERAYQIKSELDEKENQNKLL